MLLSMGTYTEFKVYILAVLALPGNRTHDLGLSMASCSTVLAEETQPFVRLWLCPKISEMHFKESYASNTNAVLKVDIL